MSDSHSEQELDAHDARADFEHLLQGILAKANAGESLASAQSNNEEDNDSKMEDSQKGHRSTLDSPHKPSTPSKLSRKRRKKDETRDDKQKSNAFIMKLFDRSVDLAAFNDHTPLYPICRAWMENDPTGKNKIKETNGGLKKLDDERASNSEDEDVGGSITEIPPPNQLWSNIDENGKYKSPRIPELIHQPNDKLDNFLSKQTPTPDSESLLVDHLAHWKKVRETWKEKSLQNDDRYEDGMTLLRDIFHRNLYNNSSSQ